MQPQILAALLAVSIFLTGCPTVDGIIDPDSLCDDSTIEPDPISITGRFSGDISGSFERDIDGVSQPAVDESKQFEIRLDSGGLVAVRPIGPSGWYFGWVDAAEVSTVGESATVEQTTHTSLLRETVTLTEFDANRERIRLTIVTEFDSRRGGSAEVIVGVSMQTIEIRPSDENLMVSIEATFDFQHTTQNPANPGLVTQRAEHFTGAGILSAISPLPGSFGNSADSRR